METSSKRFYLVFLAGLSIILTIAAIYLVWSGLYITLIEFKGLFIIGGILLIYTSLFFSIRAYVDRGLPSKARLLILFGPGISTGFAGFAGISLGLPRGIIPESLWWLPGLLGLLSFTAFQVAFVLAVPLARDRLKSSREGKTTG